MFRLVANLFRTRSTERRRAATTAARDTVVLVHGFMRAGGNMLAMGKALGPTHRVCNHVYSSKAKLIEEHAQDLVPVLREIAAAHPSEPIHFASHSMGGLIIRAALNQPDCPPEARSGRAVLLAPPNRGAAFARHLCNNRFVRWVFGNRAGRQLMETPPDGFDHLGDFPPEVQVLVIAGDLGFNRRIPGPDDGKVAVDETRLKTPHHFKRIHAGHSWIAWSPQAIRLTIIFLDPDEDPGPPPPPPEPLPLLEAPGNSGQT